MPAYYALNDAGIFDGDLRATLLYPLPFYIGVFYFKHFAAAFIAIPTNQT